MNWCTARSKVDSPTSPTTRICNPSFTGGPFSVAPFFLFNYLKVRNRFLWGCFFLFSAIDPVGNIVHYPTMATVDQKVALIVIDGWGVAGPDSPPQGDAIAAAETPHMSGFAEANSKTAQGYSELDASSLAVGLPEGLMGNSEVGHLNIGAGRVVWQDSVRIDQTLKKGEMGKVPSVVKAFNRAKEGNGRLHLLGLVSDGGVHSNITHLFALLDVAKEMQIPEVYIHFFADGRDTDPKSADGFMQQLLEKTQQIGLGAVATVVGRYYIMDRDKRWERVEVGLKGLVTGEGEDSEDPLKTIKERYEKKENDEFLKPIIVGGEKRRIKGKSSLVDSSPCVRN
ncbi:unnamed protein product [Penicillium salamii]|uniref:phosphoglycerate mutase (2,3-diphosphoglycerate-independent) n=1 Tax=Penicillium salamii TaxID=1612424 RepID=A0A9W4I4Z0_9EURO|nr:unnamed protein product [Penicillium salamii]CAG7984356.1 unnamed protein product [Penicillium salamii]CAG8005035.1 unnamed protein product [Penicillium salamii]CAG8211870.1 unnamed protein product [Penicillium salamii]CAG8243542.1 unnamed protein product [Penicillium salamii]